jgi:hypothetical protein
MVNTNPQEDKPSQATTQQRTTAHKVSDRNTFWYKCYVVAMFHHGTKGPGFGTAQGLQPTGRSFVQLPAYPHRGIRRTRRHGFTT